MCFNVNWKLTTVVQQTVSLRHQRVYFFKMTLKRFYDLSTTTLILLCLAGQRKSSVGSTSIVFLPVVSSMLCVSIVSTSISKSPGNLFRTLFDHVMCDTHKHSQLCLITKGSVVSPRSLESRSSWGGVSGDMLSLSKVLIFEAWDSLKHSQFTWHFFLFLTISTAIPLLHIHVLDSCICKGVTAESKFYVIDFFILF